MKLRPSLAPLFIASGLLGEAGAQITVTETIPVNGPSLNVYRPGQIIERLYTGDWTINWSVSGTLFDAPASSNELRITGRVGGGDYDFGTGGILPGGPIPNFYMSETFQGVAPGQSVSGQGVLQGSVNGLVGNNTSSFEGEETWSLIANHEDYNTYVNGLLDYYDSIGNYSVFGAFVGTLQLTYRVFAVPHTLVCTGGARLETYGASNRLYFLEGSELQPSTATLLVEGTAAPATSLGLCLSGNIRRVPGSFQYSSAAGSYRFAVDPFAYPAGTTSAFQLWYRIPGGTEFSDAVEVQVR